MVSFLYFDGFKIKDGRSPGIAGHPVRRADRDVPPGQRLHRQPAARPVEDRGRPRRSARTCSCRRSTRYYNTGFVLDARRRAWTCRRAATSSTGAVVRLDQPEPQRPPAEDRQRRPATRSSARCGASHDVKYGFGWRTRRTRSTGTLWPGNGILALEQTPTTCSAQVFREGSGGNRAELPRLLRRRHHLEGPRDDRPRRPLRPAGRQGAAERHAGEPGVPERRARASNFAGYDAPFTWNNFSPRAGLTYALDDDAQDRGARELQPLRRTARHRPRVGYMNPSSAAGVGRRIAGLDINGDHFAQADEVQLNQFIAAAGGFNPANPTAVTSANRLDPDLKAPVHARASSPASIASCMPNFAVGGELQLHAHDGSVRQRHVLRSRRASASTLRATTRRARLLTGTLPDGTPLQRADLHSEPGGGRGRRQRVPADELCPASPPTTTASSSAP